MSDLFRPDAPDARAKDAEVSVRGVVKSVVFRAADGAFAVLRVATLDGREVVAIGDLGAVEEGEHLRLIGRWERHARHGTRLRTDTCVPELPSTPDGMKKFLGSGVVDGIGAGMAGRIVDRFGSSTFDVILDHPDRLREVEGIGPQRADRIREAFRARRAEAEARAYMAAVGLGPKLTQRIVRRFGDAAPTVVREDPYRLAAEIPGIGFRTADRIGRLAGIPLDDPRRACGAVLHTLGEARDAGHTCLPWSVLVQRCETLEIPRAVTEQAWRRLASETLVLEDAGFAYLPELLEAEQGLAEHLRDRSAARPKDVPPRVLADPALREVLAALHPLQQQAVRTALDASVSVLTGGPGTGKTTAVRAIVAFARAAGLQLSLAAPTGRAARRMTEATGEVAATVHRLLEWNPRLAAFGRSEDAPLDADLLVVDESSMLDVQLARSLLAAVRPGARVIFVGDVDQLPSVGPGTVLADLIRSGAFPVTRLTEVFRQAQSSAIVRGAHALLAGHVPTFSPPRAAGVAQAPAGELYFVRADEPEAAAEKVVRTVASRIPEAFGLHPLRDVQVLVPSHKGPLGTQALNAALQAALNLQLTADGGKARFAAGDKVMQQRNNYELDIWNGDVGVVLAVDGDRVTVDFDGRRVTVEGEDREELALAYAATVHKAQGSEYDAVVLGLHTSHFVMLERSLFYTALTRARRLAVIVGNERALRLALRSGGREDRYGRLVDRLAGRA